jgi:hypothetical protein
MYVLTTKLLKSFFLNFFGFIRERLKRHFIIANVTAGNMFIEIYRSSGPDLKCVLLQLFCGHNL